MLMNVYVFALSVSIIYFLIKLFEMKYMKKEDITLKTILRDTLLVYISVVVGDFIIAQIIPATNSVVSASSSPEVFTDAPNF